jgi:hypothetical protein
MKWEKFSTNKFAKIRANSMAAFELLLSENSKLFIKSIYYSDDALSRIHRSCFKVVLKGGMSLNSATGLIFRD